MDAAARATTGLAAAEAELAAAKAALLAPMTGMIVQATQLAAVVVSNIAGFRAMAAAEGLATAAAVTLESVMLLLNSPLVILVASIAALKFGWDAIVGGINDGLAAFSKSEDQIARIAISMKNLGNVFPTGELVEFSGRLSRLTGIDDEAIASLGAMAIQFGLTRQQAEALVPTVLDVATANKTSFEETERAILRFTSTGQTRGLLALHIDPKSIKGDIHDIDNVMRQLGRTFEGTAAAFRNTLPGTELALRTATENFNEAVGRLFSPERLAWLKIWTRLLEGATILLEAAANYWKIPTAAELGKGKPNELALKGDPEQTELMRQTANNTAQLDPLVKEVLGGKGIIARRAYNLRDAKMAFGL